jgi:RNA polymerase sigma-70 factor (sigma-E family)
VRLQRLGVLKEHQRPTPTATKFCQLGPRFVEWRDRYSVRRQPLRCTGRIEGMSRAEWQGHEVDREFAAFVETGWTRFLRLATMLTGDQHRAEELLQDSLVKLYVQWRRASIRGGPDAYLRRILVNGNVSWWRRHRWEHLVALAPERPDCGPERQDHRDLLRWALLQLPDRQRVVIVLRHYEDLAEKDVAALLGCSVGTVKSQNARALRRLRELLGDLQRQNERVRR